MSEDFADDPERLIVNKSDLARQILKCSLPTVNELLVRYPDFPVLERGTQGAEWKFDVAAVVAFLEERKQREREETERREDLFAQLRLPLRDEAAEGAPSAAARLNAIKALLLEQKLAKEAGQLVRVDEIQSAFQTAMRHFARHLDVLPANLGREFNLPGEIVRAMRKYVDDARRRMVAEIKAALKEGNDDGIDDA